METAVRQYTCKHCGLTFVQPFELGRHVLKAHPRPKMENQPRRPRRAEIRARLRSAMGKLEKLGAEVKVLLESLK